MYKKIFFSLLILFVVSNEVLFAQLSTIRVGAGIGGSIYVGNQMDENISFSTYNKSEVNIGNHFELYKTINNNNEIGFRYLATDLWSFKSNNTLALNAEINEFAFIYQRSLNNNSNIDLEKFTINAVGGLGACYFKSAFYDINIENRSFSPFSAVGFGNIATKSGNVIPEKEVAWLAILGFNVGYRVNNYMSVYFENTLTLSNTNKISGNLFRKSNLPPDGYFYSAFTVYINYVSFKNHKRVKCPKF
jgi:hypothetical protein